jgi:hypothetical protein
MQFTPRFTTSPDIHSRPFETLRCDEAMLRYTAHSAPCPLY